MQPAREAVACLIGPTASGKSGLAIALALRGAPGPVEIISLDSAQVYCGLDIGTAKPSASEQAAVRHHLIDLVPPEVHYSVARCHADVLRTVSEIRSRGAQPLIVGGTMLYYKALLHGLDQLPPTPAEVRAQIAQAASALGWPELHRQLHAVDPETASRLAPTDAQRISRALEVWEHTGRPLSDWVRSSQAAPSERLQPLAMRTLALMPQDRAWLHARIASRFEEMVSAGLLEEVEGLMQRPGLTPDHPSMRSVGYRQAWLHLSGRLSRADFLQKGIEATRQLAKRQITWLRSFATEGSIVVLPAETAGLDLAMAVWASPG